MCLSQHDPTTSPSQPRASNHLIAEVRWMTPPIRCFLRVNSTIPGHYNLPE